MKTWQKLALVYLACGAGFVFWRSRTSQTTTQDIVEGLVGWPILLVGAARVSL